MQAGTTLKKALGTLDIGKREHRNKSGLMLLPLFTTIMNTYFLIVKILF